MTRWLIANWKMNGTAAQARAYAFAVNQALTQLPPTLKAVFCPPAPYLAQARDMLPLNAQLTLGGQNCHAAEKGAYTGEISAPMLREVGAHYVILGHSERRAAGETDAQVLEKATACLTAGLIPVICVGEDRAAYEAGNTVNILQKQLKDIHQLPQGGYLVAYEPIWAIGTGLTPKTSEISAAHAAIKSMLGSATYVLYGGSVNAGNIGEILSVHHVSGALIGGASLEIETMKAMLAIAAT